MDNLHCVKESLPLINEVEKVHKIGTILKRDYCIYKKDQNALM